MVFSDFKGASTPNWWLRGGLIIFVLAFVGWMLNVVHIFNVVSGGGWAAAFDSLAAPVGYADLRSCDASHAKACFVSSTTYSELTSASVQSLADSFAIGVSADAATCSATTTRTQTCSGSATITMPGAASLSNVVDMRYAVTTGDLATDSTSLNSGTLVTFTVTGHATQ